MSSVQGTVASFDESSRHGSVLLDDGTPVAFAAEAFAASGLRLLRVGQRIRLECDVNDVVVRIAIPTMP